MEDRSLPTVGGGFTAAGVLGEYFANSDLAGSPAFTRRDVRIDFDWGALGAPGGSPAPGYRDVGSDHFSVRWTGQFVPQFSETYLFTGTADDNLRLLVKPADGTDWTTLIDRWTGADQPTTTVSAGYSLVAGRTYDLRVEYQELTGPAGVHLAWSSPSTPATTVEPLGIAGGHVDPYTPMVFADAMKSGRRTWGRPEDNLGSDVPLDANGWPTQDAANVVWEGRVGPEMVGTYRLRFAGTAQVSFWGGAGSWSAGGATYTGVLPKGAGYDPTTNTTTADLTLTANDGILVLTFTRAERDGRTPGPGYGVTDVRLMRPTAVGSPTPYPVGTVFTDAFKAANAPYVALRWNDTNGDAEADWADRTRPTAKTVVQSASGGKWAYEYEVMLANELGKDLYVTVPVKATDDYLRNLANLIRYGSDGSDPYTGPVANPAFPGLNPNLKVYVEFSNEVWNTAGAFPQTQWADDAAKAAAAAPAGSPQRADWDAINYDGTLPTGGTLNMTRLRRWLALRTVRASDAFRGVFEPDNTTAPMGRVRVLFEYMGDNIANTASDPLRFLDEYFNNGDGIAHVSAPRPVSYYLWGAGAAGYYGSGNPTGAMANDPFGATGSFESPAVPAGATTADPTGTGWTFAGNAGVYRDPTLTEAVTGQTPGASRTTATNMAYGLAFTVGPNPVAVYELGRWVSAGNIGTHTVRIVRASDRVTVAAADVATKGTAAGQYAYAVLGVPVVLDANTTYYLMSAESAGGDAFAGDGTAVALAPGLTAAGAVSATYGGASWDTSAWGISTTAAGGRSFGPVTLRFATQPVGDLGYAPEAPDGSQAAYLGDGGSVSTAITVPADGTYAVAFRAAGKDGRYLQLPFDVEIDGVRYTPNYVLGTGALTSVNPTSWAAGTGQWGVSPSQFGSYTSAPAFLTAGTHTVRFVGRGYSWTAPGAYAFLDRVTLASADAIFAGGMPTTGQATGQTGTGDYAADTANAVRYAQAYGLHPVAYEFGWSLGGDTGATPLQNWAKYRDPRTAEVNAAAIDIFARAGGSLLMMGSYQQWPIQETDTAAAAALLHGVELRDDQLPAAPTNGLSVPAVLTPDGKRWGSGVTGSTVSPNGFMVWNVLVARGGTYTITLTTTAGGTAQLSADDATLIAAGGTGGALTGSVYLSPGLHALKVKAAAGSFQVGQLVASVDGAPQPPTVTGEADGNGSATLTWTAADGATGYRILYGTSPGAYSASVSVGAATTGTVTGLVHNTVYYFAVAAENDIGLSLPSAERAVMSLDDGRAGGLAGWEFANLPAGATSPTSAAAVTTSRLTVSPLTRGAGLAASSSSWAGDLRKGRFASEPAGQRGYQYAQTLSDAGAYQQYYQFSVTPTAGMTARLDGLSLRPYFQNARPTLGVGVQYSTDGVNFMTVADSVVPQKSSDPFAVDLSPFADLRAVTGTVTFRIYLYGAGKYEVTGLGQDGGNDLALTGALSPSI